DYAQMKSHDRITTELVGKALAGQGIDGSGLDLLDRKVLRAIVEIYSGGPVGIESLAATLNEEVDTIVDVVEPFLLKSGFLKRTSRGRETTALAREHLRLSRETAKTADLFSEKK
ncbi:MAG: Holliday junction DNA helicase RuvB C-terminal domain-containing protein, partial [Candidatus Omnitrophota bacterium]